MPYSRYWTSGERGRNEIKTCTLGLLIALFVLGGAVRPTVAQEASPCEEALGAAESAYLNGNFDEAIRLISPCLDRSDVPEEQAVQAYRLLSLAHLQQDELPEARAAIVDIFSIRPGYEADPVEDPPSYVSLVSIVRSDVQPAQLAEETEGDAEEERSTPFFRRTSTWLSIAGSLLVGGVVTLVTVGQGGGGDNGGGPGGSDSLPEPPGTPSSH